MNIVVRRSRAESGDRLRRRSERQEARGALARLVGLDCGSWALALFVATALRFDLQVTRIDATGLAIMIGIAFAAQTVVGTFSGLYRGRWRLGSSDELAALVGSVGGVTALLFAADLPFSARPVPLGAVLAAGVLALVLTGGTRYWRRRSLERRWRTDGQPDERILVFGAGEGGAQVIDALLRARPQRQAAIGLLDDDPRKRNLRIRGVPVLGDRTSLRKAALSLAADTLLIAIPSADAELIQDLSAMSRGLALQTKILPPVGRLFGPVAVDDIRPLTDDSVLGRRQVDLGVAMVAAYLEGKRVLVTGAGGSIGAELCHQIDAFRPAELLMLDHDESGLHAVELSIRGRALLDDREVLLGDVRDREGMLRLFASHRPEVVFHAAALKHLPLLESYPAEAVKTNILGTWHVLEAAMASGVQRFVNISTDKAADPISVLGYSKAIGSRLTAHAATRTGRPYLSVRFGNVIGSRGSVIPAFEAQVAAGGPVTVTHPDVTRFFMTCHEAVQLLIQAGAVGAPGEVLVLDMGDPVRISELARRFINRDEREIGLVFTGLRPGEKLHEVLLGEAEVEIRRSHPLIRHIAVRALHPSGLAAFASDDDPASLRESMRRLAVGESPDALEETESTGEPLPAVTRIASAKPA